MSHVPLPRGFGALPPEQARALHRSRLLEAVDALVAEQGYDGLSVSAIVSRAGVSKSTFYEHFTDKRAAFLACWEGHSDRLRVVIADAVTGQTDWREMVRVAVLAYLRAVAEQPAAARVFAVESMSAGPDALALRADLRASFTDFYAGARALAGRAPLDPLLIRALVEALQGMVEEWIRTGRTEQLEELAPMLQQLTLLVLDSP